MFLNDFYMWFVCKVKIDDVLFEFFWIGFLLMFWYKKFFSVFFIILYILFFFFSVVDLEKELIVNLIIFIIVKDM